MGKTDDFEYLGPALATLRKRRSIPVRSMAEQLGVSASLLSRCESGRRDFSSRELLRYLEIVRATLTELHVAMDVFKYTR